MISEANSNVNSTQAQSSKHSALHIWYTNADTLHNKLDELRCRIGGEKAPDIIVITESLPKNRETNLQIAEFNLDGYNIFSNNSTRGRGIIIYTRKHLKVQELTVESDFEEYLSVKIELKKNEIIALCAIYRSPSSLNTNNEELHKLLKSLDETCQSQKIIVGDFNYPGIDWTRKEASGQNAIHANMLLSTLDDLYWTQHVNYPTRVRGDNIPSILDLVITSDPDMISTVDCQGPLGRSDHSLLQFDVLNTEPAFVEDLRPALHKADFVKMRKKLDKNWSDILQDHQDDVNKMWETFVNIVRQAQEECIPKYRPANGKIRQALDRETIQLIKKKHRVWNRYMETRQQDKFEEYKRLRNQIRNRTRNIQRSKEKEIANDIRKNPKKFWRHVNNNTKYKTAIPDLISPEGTKVTSDKEKAESLGQYFSSVYVTENCTNLPEQIESNTQTVLYNVCFNEEKVRKKLSELKIDKSPGPDGFHPRVLRETATEIAPAIAIIFQTSFRNGKLPDQWKIGNICAIHKKGPKSICGNYRPVSLTSILCKTMESIIRDEIMIYMRSQNLFSHFQYGFLPKRSTIQQLLKIMDQWTEELDSGLTIETVYLDFKKAFDTVPHLRLLNKLQAFGITGRLKQWIQDFLLNRTQRVKINNILSTPLPVTSGVPQGSVLGPILFLLYINDLPQGINSNCYMFADDTKIYRKLQADAYINDYFQQDLDKLQAWSDKWLLQFHPDKCKRMHIKRRQSDSRTTPVHLYKDITGNRIQVTLETVSQHKDLGIMVDEKLSFESHIIDIVRKANQMMGLITRIFRDLCPKVFIPLYKALVRSRLEYGQTIWAPHHLKDIRKLEAVQRRATKRVVGLKLLTYSERLRKLQLPTLSYRRSRGDMIEMYKISHGIYEESTTINMSYSHTGLRGHEYKLFYDRPETNLRKFSFRCRVVNPWNNLPQHVVGAPSLSSFKRRLDRHWENHPLLYNAE